MAETKCIVCGGTDREGIYVGSGFICTECEARIVAAEPGTDEYEALMRALRGLDIKRDELDADQAEALERELNSPERLSAGQLLARVGLKPKRRGVLRCAEKPVWATLRKPRGR